MELKIGNWLTLRAGEKPQPNELGATGTSVFAGLLYENEYNADLQGERGIKVFDRMRRSDGQVKAGLLACKLPLQVAHWDMAPASEDAVDVAIAETVKEDLFENMTITWGDFLRQSLIMLDFGHMVFEKVWEFRDGRWTWHKLAPRLPQSLVQWYVKPDGGLDYIVQQAYIGTNFQQVNLPVDKVLVFTHEMEGSEFRGMSLLRAAYKHWYYKNNLYAIDGIAAERHGVGLATFTFPDQATQKQKDELKAIGERLHAHERSYVATPESIKFDLKGVQGQLHDIKGSIEHHDLQIVRSILAQFMNLGAKSTGSYALSQDQSSFFLMALQSVGKNICDTVNRHCIKQMVDYNWEVKRYPKLTVSGLDNPDIIGYAQAISQLVTATAIVPDTELENELRRMLKLPLKKADGPRPGAPGRPQAEATPREWPANAGESMRAAEFWRAPTTLEKSVAFSDITKRLTSFEEEFVKAVGPIQKRQADVLVDTISGYIKDGQFDRMAEIDVPFRDKVAKAIEGMLSDLMAYGAEQVKAEAKRQGTTVKAQESAMPIDPAAFIKVRSMAIANIMANKMRSALSWEALRQLREGAVDKGRLTAAVMDLSDRDLRDMAGLSVSEAFNFGRQSQAEQMGIKRVTSSALMDDNTCDYCREMDGKSWTPGDEQVGEPPYEGCDGRDRCRCVWIYTFTQEI